MNILATPFPPRGVVNGARTSNGSPGSVEPDGRDQPPGSAPTP